MPAGHPTTTVQERRTQLLELIRSRRFATLDELAGALGVSESTIRRDLEYLEKQGDAKRIHGGALYTGSSPKLPHFETRQPMRWEQKRAIARKAVELISAGDSVLLDGGTTTYEVARLLLGMPLHVVTNSLPVANLLASDPTSDLVFVGGNVCPRTGVTQGPQADAMIASLRVRKAILSVASADEEGFFNNNLLLVETERAMMRAADEVIIVADSSKFGYRSLALLCKLEDVDYVVTDTELPEAWRERLTSAGVRLILASVAESAEEPVLRPVLDAPTQLSPVPTNKV
ncbi:transcriptional regulator, DeoR family [Thermogutta terrifontis]|uniref:Transcriptional regulator, DeoR family n=1 Tax=Thermogutta terrifontis TaxID=1331910 RepID=A0A286RD85_9BACT|nr:DeoR/GlpR family DNA-binding transcription regulator [Thermogutta terrifontis]ASV73916.1 transcriptional regulator, DeoR family [Thermogutta terrifontis]